MQPRRETRPPRRDAGINWTAIASLAAAVIGLWAAQSLFIPMIPRAVEIPYSEFKSKLAAGEISEVTLGTPIEGVMKNSGAKYTGAGHH